MQLRQTGLRHKLRCMTRPFEALEPAHLDELAAVTKEYATWSRTAYGFAAIGTGAVVLAFVGLDVLVELRLRLALSGHRFGRRRGGLRLTALLRAAVGSGTAFCERHVGYLSRRFLFCIG